MKNGNKNPKLASLGLYFQIQVVFNSGFKIEKNRTNETHN